MGTLRGITALVETIVQDHFKETGEPASRAVIQKQLVKIYTDRDQQSIKASSEAAISYLVKQGRLERTRTGVNSPVKPVFETLSSPSPSDWIVEGKLVGVELTKENSFRVTFEAQKFYQV